MSEKFWGEVVPETKANQELSFSLKSKNLRNKKGKENANMNSKWSKFTPKSSTDLCLWRERVKMPINMRIKAKKVTLTENPIKNNKSIIPEERLNILQKIMTCRMLLNNNIQKEIQIRTSLMTWEGKPLNTRQEITWWSSLTIIKMEKTIRNKKIMKMNICPKVDTQTEIPISLKLEFLSKILF